MKIFTAITTIFYSMMVFANKVYAQDEWGVNDLNDVNLGTNNLFDTITNLINIVLGFLGIIAVGIVLYGGFLWMTSAGNVEKVQKAKLALISGVIGLAIIVSAYAIASFVLRGLATSTGVIVGGTTVPPIIVVDPPPCICGAALKVCAVSPGETGVGGVVTIQGCNLGTAGTVVIENATDSAFAEPVSCSGNIADAWGATRIQVRIPELPLANDYSVVVTPVGPDTYRFPEDNPDVGDHLAILASPNPSIICLDPEDQYIGDPVDIQGTDFGPGQDSDTIFIESTGISIAHDALGVFWADDLITFNVPVDTDTGNIQVVLDDGAAPPRESNNALLGVSCGNDSDCSTGCCWTGNDTCRAVDPYCLNGTDPRIIYIDPQPSAEANLITITGVNFGDNGRVLFNDVEGLLPGALNPDCAVADYYTPTRIIIGVPYTVDLADADNIQVTVERDVDFVSSNILNFVKDVVYDRPGVCRVDPGIGFFGDPIDVYGVGFDATANVLFGGIADNVGPGCAATECIDALVPNLVSSNVSVQVENAAYSSNSYPFIVQENLTGVPIISEMTPDTGPYREYVTIIGSNFGNSQGTVSFDGNETNVLDDFPAQCMNNIWTNNRIIAKVPDLGGADINDVEVLVTRSGDGTTNDVAEDENNFDYAGTGDPSPGLCSIQPNNGPQGYSPIHLFGDNFQAQNVASDVIFHSSQSATIADWATREIEVAVPDLTQSGDVVVNVNAEISNPLTFNVGECESNPDNCSVIGDVCCPTPGGDICLPQAQCDFGPRECEYEWEILTVADPFGPIVDDYCISPTPWPDGRQLIESREVYTSSNLSLFFNRNIYNADLRNLENFKVFWCDDQDPVLYDETDCIDGSGDELAGSLSVLSNDSDQEGILFNPGADLDPDTWYKVEYGQAPDGFRAQVGGDVWTWGMAPGTIDWHFKTRSNTDVCYVDNVSVTPVPNASYFTYGDSRSFSALPMSANCNICGNQYNWSYDMVANGNQTVVDLLPGINTRNIGLTTMYSNPTNPAHFPTENYANPDVVFEASVVNFEDGIRVFGTGTSVVLAPNFEVVHHEPDCDDACSNSQVTVTFSTPFSPGSMNPANFNILTVANTPIPLDDRTVQLNGGVEVFVPGVTYTVEIAAATEDIYGNILGGSGFTWNFTIGDQGMCSVASARIRPEDIEVPIGRVTDYIETTYSAPGICYPAGQAINCAATPGCAWSGFTSTDPDVAEVTDPIEGLVYASSSPQPPPANTVTISNTATQGADSFPVNTTLTVLEGPPPIVYESPEIIDFSPPQSSVDICVDALTTVEFNMPMDIASVEDSFKLFIIADQDLHSFVSWIDCYHYDNVGQRLAGLDNSFDYLCEIPASWAVQHLMGNRFVVGGNMFENMTYVAGAVTENTGLPGMNTDNVTPADYVGVSSINGTPMDYDNTFGAPDTAAWHDLDGDGDNDGFFWTFEVGERDCVPNRVEIFPSYDMFTCATDNCLGDASSTIAGNQHGFFAMVWDINNDPILRPVSEYSWSLIGSELTYMTLEGAWPAVFVNPIPNPDNARDFLRVTFDMPESPNYTFVDTVPIDINICEVPWPDPTASVYWEDVGGGLASNFSTNYCAWTGRDTDLSLPNINYPPMDLNNIDGDVLRDFLLIVNPNTSSTAMNFSESMFGSLAYKGGATHDNFNNKNKRTFFDSLVALKDKIFNNEQVTAQSYDCDPIQAPPTNLRATVLNGNQVNLSWESSVLATYFEITKIDFPSPPTIIGTTAGFSWVDNIVAGEAYQYSVRAYQVHCPPLQRWSNPAGPVYVGNQNLADAIGVRVMSNPDNLSLQEWYSRNAPNPDSAGSIMYIDGFPSMRVGTTVYIDGVNTTDFDDIYKNIYILSYSQGAHNSTINIFNQFVDNFKLNANWDPIDRGTDTCNDSPGTVYCSSDFDCQVGSCDSRALKLRRDIVRLGNLFDIEKYLYSYGVNNMYCPGNPNIGDGQPCPSGGDPVQYYPLLNQGSYVQGITNSSWPSWQDNSPNDLQYILSETLPIDPINKFNGCLAGAEPSTCWSPDDLEFYCQDGSLMYMYRAEDDGRDYTLGANFEYDDDPWNNVTFADDFSPLVGHDHLVADLGPSNLCDGTLITNPPGNPDDYCGDGIINGGEICDGDILPNACDNELTDQNWWNETSAGCFMPGTVDECTFYSYIADGGYTIESFTNYCGGYCGDGEFQDFYEQCEDTVAEGMVYDDNYTCSTGAVTCGIAAGTCQAMCGSEPAAVCGDGILSIAEACDASASPSGLAGWDCSIGAVATCDECAIVCVQNDIVEQTYHDASGTYITNIGMPYVGMCGNGIETNLGCSVAYIPTNAGLALDAIACLAAGGDWWYFAEQCDFYDYEAPPPMYTQPPASARYECSNACRYDGGYCGDGIQQYEFEELCDPGNYTTPTPEYSHKFAQYVCSTETDIPGPGYNPYVDPETSIEYFACTPTQGGYCGDGITQDGIINAPGLDYGEICDTDYPLVPILPADSREDNQYGCDDTCMSYGGGWCGDSIVNDGQTNLPRHGLGYGEVCDEGDYIDREFGTCDSVSCEWNCYGDVDGNITSPAINTGHADLLFGGSSLETLNPGESTILSLPACRVSETITLTMDVTTGIEVPKTGVIFITDTSNSMRYCVEGWTPGTSFPGFGSQGDCVPSPAQSGITYNPPDTRLDAAIDALTDGSDTCGTAAIWQIFDRNSQADIALVNYSNDADTTVDGFRGLTDQSDICTDINDYWGNLGQGTYHVYAMEEAQTLIEDEMSSGDIDQFIVVFMTDGRCQYDFGAEYDDDLGYNVDTNNCVEASIAKADIIRNLDPDNITIIGVSITNPTIDEFGLKGLVNAVANDCVATVVGGEVVAPGTGTSCGDGDVQCLNDDDELEECEPHMAGCTANCTWSTNLQRYFDYEQEGGNLDNLYNNIVGIIPVAGVTIELDGYSNYVEIPEGATSVDVELDMRYLNTDRCEEFSGNYFNLRAGFTGPPGTQVTFRNGVYNFCPWRNGGASSYY